MTTHELESRSDEIGGDVADIDPVELEETDEEPTGVLPDDEHEEGDGND